MATTGIIPRDIDSADPRSRIIAAATALIAEGGSEAATTRAIAGAAAVQAPTIYRLFGDKTGLLEAVAEQAFADYVATKVRREPVEDPIDDLRQSWDIHIAFGVSHPAVFALINTARPGQGSAASATGLAVLLGKVRRIARSGRLAIAEERAVDLIHAMGTGTVLALLQKAPKDRNGLSEAAFDSVLTTIVSSRTDRAANGPALAASMLRACLAEVKGLTPGEKHLMEELLRRIANEA